MNDGLKNFLASLKQLVAKQTGQEDDKEKFAKHLRKTVLKPDKTAVENKTQEHLRNGDKIED
jgi:hypothetical protein